MNVPLRTRLHLCAALLPSCHTVADVGTDHGYLPIWLLTQGLCSHVIAADLREKPLQTARQNAARFGTLDRTTFVQSDGLHNIKESSFDALVCAGMGGDCIAGILDAAPWLRDERYTLVLQPQSSGNDLRRYLGEHGWRIEREQLCRDGRFLYAAMRVRFGGSTPLSPGEQFLSPALLREGGPYLEEYRARLVRALTATVTGISKGETADDRRKLAYYSAALQEINAMPVS